MNHLFNEEWRTRLTTRADAAGRLTFRGFKGQYRLTWRDANGATQCRVVTVD